MKNFSIIVPEYTNRVKIEFGDYKGLKNYLLVVCDSLPSQYCVGNNGIFTVTIHDEAGYAYQCCSSLIDDNGNATVEFDILFGIDEGEDSIEKKNFRIVVELYESAEIGISVSEG